MAVSLQNNRKPLIVLKRGTDTSEMINCVQLTRVAELFAAAYLPQLRNAAWAVQTAVQCAYECICLEIAVPTLPTPV